MSKEITVAGGGAVAAAVALAAAARAMQVHYFYPADYGGGGGRHYALSKRSVDFLQRLGVALHPQPVNCFQLTAGGRDLTLTNNGQPLCWMSSEEALTDALTRRVQEMNITPRPYHELRLQDSSSGGLELLADDTVHRTDLLAIADGARSPLAAALGIGGRSVDFQQQAVVARVVTSALAADTAAQWFGDNDIVALLPAGGNTFSLVWSTATPPPAAEVSERLRQRLGIMELTVSEKSIRTFPLRAFVRAVQVAPHAALVGDAAGTIHPLAGQGLNLGLADAETLIRCVHRRRRQTMPLALSSYHLSRSRRRNQLHQLTAYLVARERRAAQLFAFAQLPFLQRAAIAFANA